MANSVDPKWADRVRVGDRRALLSQFSHEARELKRIVAEYPQGVHPLWMDFRQFLADVGPSPGPSYRLVPSDISKAGSYRPGGVRWATRANLTKAQQPLPPQPRPVHAQWTMLAGMPIQYAELPERLGLSFATISAALAENGDLDALAQGVEGARDAIAELEWFSSSTSHQQAFREAFMAWRLRVSPRYRPAATPKFLYLYMLLPAMAEAKATLAKVGLWAPQTREMVERRDASYTWRRFNEMLPKTAATIAEFEIYRQFSLIDDIETLSERVVAAERQFRAPTAG